MARTNKRRRPEAIPRSQFIEPLEEETITVFSPPPPLPPEERFEYSPLLIQKILSILLYPPSAFESGLESSLQRLDLSKLGQKTEVQG
ncbi:hypothetical protein V1523DRAFT_418901 [Lipomyces doorenjongii]